MFARSLFLVLGLFSGINIAFASSQLNSNEIEDDFVTVKRVNMAAEALFPKQFSQEQIRCFFKQEQAPHSKVLQFVGSNKYGQAITKEVITPIGNLSVDQAFHEKIAPNRVQIITGTAASYASKIHFTNAVLFESDVLKGIYEYSSSYAYLYSLAAYSGNITFPVNLTLDPSFIVLNPNNLTGKCQIFNMRDSVLGQHDFISPPCQLNPANKMIPNASIYMIYNTDEEFIRQTNEGMQRLPENTKTWLLLLNELRYGNLHNLSEEERGEIAKGLYKDLLKKFNFDENHMALDNFVTCILSLRHDILGCLGLTEKDIPVLDRSHIIPLSEGKVFFLAPEKDPEVILNS